MYFEKSSVWANLLGASSLVDAVRPKLPSAADCVLSLRNFPKSTVADMNTMQVYC